MKIIKITFAFILISLTATFAVGQDDFERPKPPPDRTSRLARILELTPEQQTQIRKLNRQGRLKMRDAQSQVRQAKKELDEQIYADEVDEELVKTKLNNLVEAQARVLTLRARSELAVRNVLTPTQLEKFREVWEQRKRNQRRRQMNRQRNQRQRNLERRKGRKGRRDGKPPVRPL